MIGKERTSTFAQRETLHTDNSVSLRDDTWTRVAPRTSPEIVPRIFVLPPIDARPVSLRLPVDNANLSIGQPADPLEKMLTSDADLRNSGGSDERAVRSDDGAGPVESSEPFGNT